MMDKSGVVLIYVTDIQLERFSWSYEVVTSACLWHGKKNTCLFNNTFNSSRRSVSPEYGLLSSFQKIYTNTYFSWVNNVSVYYVLPQESQRNAEVHCFTWTSVVTYEYHLLRRLRTNYRMWMIHFEDSLWEDRQCSIYLCTRITEYWNNNNKGNEIQNIAISQLEEQSRQWI